MAFEQENQILLGDLQKIELEKAQDDKLSKHIFQLEVTLCHDKMCILTQKRFEPITLQYMYQSLTIEITITILNFLFHVLFHIGLRTLI